MHDKCRLELTFRNTEIHLVVVNPKVWKQLERISGVERLCSNGALQDKP